MATKAPAITAAGIYARISKDDRGEALGVDRQERLCRKLAESKGWNVVEVFTDNDLSASTGKRRPAYEALKRAITDKRVNAVVVFDLDRLHRRPAELEDFMEVADAHDVALATVGGDVNLSNPDDRFKARIMGAVAKAETEKMSKRLRAKHAELAEQGLPAGLGGSRPFGYLPADPEIGRRGGMEIDHDEANLLRAAAADVLSGVPLSAIARRWNQAGVRSPFPRTTTLGWRPGSVKALLLSPRPAGIRRHRPAGGEIVEFPAAWPAIIDRATHDRLVATLTANKGASAPRRRTLLTGLVRCGLCGSTMMRDSKRGIVNIRCRSGAGRPGCGKVGMRADAVEEAIVARVMAYIELKASADMSRAMSAGHHDEAGEVASELMKAERFKLMLAEKLAAGADFDDEELVVMRRRNREQITALRARMAELTSISAATRWDSVEAFEKAWAAADIDAQWGLLRALVEYAEIGVATGKQRDRERITVKFRQ